MVYRHGNFSILEAVDEIRGLTSKNGHESSLAARRECPKPKPLISRRKANTATLQYSQTATLRRHSTKEKKFKWRTLQLAGFKLPRSETHRLKPAELDERTEDEYDLNWILQAQR